MYGYDNLDKNNQSYNHGLTATNTAYYSLSLSATPALHMIRPVLIRSVSAMSFQSMPVFAGADSVDGDIETTK